MTTSFKLEEITKINIVNLEATQKLLSLAGFELDEIWEHDSGDYYEVWSQPKNCKQIVLEVMKLAEHDISDVVSEIIDCWFELREIKELLSANEPELSLKANELTAYERFLAEVKDQKITLASTLPTLRLVFGQEPDVELLSFFELDENTKNAILQ